MDQIEKIEQVDGAVVSAGRLSFIVLEPFDEVGRLIAERDEEFVELTLPQPRGGKVRLRGRAIDGYWPTTIPVSSA